jgi:hypothetical protein
MRKIFPLIIGLGCLVFYPRPAQAVVMSAPKPKFAYKDASGKKQSVEVIDKYYPKKIVKPFAKADTTSTPNSVGRPPLPRNAHVRIPFRSAGAM